jgi:hypothetical protein
MGYGRSFRQLRTHVLCPELPEGSLEQDRALVYDALREGCCYIAVDALAPARGFSFWADGGVPMGAEAEFAGQSLHAVTPRPASALRLIRDGAVVAAVEGAAIDYEAPGPGVYRVEARLPYRGRELTWIVSNPVYLRG